MSSAGSLRGVKVDGIPFNVAGDANVALNPRVEKTSLPHSGGNMIQRTLMPADVEAVKLTVTPSQYSILEGLSEQQGSIPLSYEMGDGSTFRSTGEVMLGPYQTEESACEVTFKTSTGIWENFSQT